VNCIIIDDNELAIKTLKSLLANFCPKVNVLSSCQDINSGVKMINDLNPDFIFLDVEIKEEIGFDIFSFFPSPNFSVIFTTAHEKYALEAIKKKCFGYLLKPIDPAELVGILNQLEEIKTVVDENVKVDSTKRISFIINDEHVFIDENDIVYLMADGKYTDIITKNSATYKSSKNLEEIESSLSSNFFRCHKGHIVNMNFVEKFIKNELRIVLADGSYLYLASRRKDEFLKLFHRF